MSDALKIQVIVDGAQVTVGMDGVTSTIEAATARIKAAFGSVEKAPSGIQNALKVLQNQARMSGETVAFATEQINALGGAAGGAAPRVVGLGSAAGDTSAKMTSMERAMALATGRMAGMASGAGMLGGALGRVGAASSTLGPLLAAAFPVIAIAAFVDIAVMAYEKILDVTSAMAGWDKEAKQMNDLLISLNQQTVSFNANLAIEKLRLNEIGLKGSALDLQRQKDLTSELAIRTDELTASLHRQNAIRAQLQGTSRTVDVLNPRTRTTQTRTIIDKPEKDEASRLNKELEESIKNSQKLREEIVKLKEISIPGEEKKTQVDIEAEHAKAVEHARESAEKFTAAMQKLSNEKERADLLTRKLTEDQEEFARREENADAVQGTKVLAERLEAEREFQQGRIADAKQAEITEIEIEQEKVKELFRLGKITADQQAQQLNDLEAKKLEIEKAYLQQRIDTILKRLNADDEKNYKEDLKEWDKLLKDKQKDEDDYLKKRQKNIDGSATIEEKRWERLTQKINASFDQSIHGLIRGTLSFGQAFANVLDGLLGDFISFLVKQALKWAENHLLMLAQHSAFLSAKLGLDTANHAATAAEGAVAASLQVTQQAGVAGAAGFASVMEALPFPVNVSVAPGVMASSIAQTLSNLSLASAAGGFDVPHDMLAMIHKNEMVLPANLSSGLKDLIGSGSGGGGGDVHVHYSVSAVDARGVEDFFHRNQPALEKTIRRAVRRANL